MSVNSNPASVAGPNQGEFHPRVPGSEPLTTKGHAPGTLVGNDAKPEFHAETHPVGTAPSKDAYQPDPSSEVIPGQAPKASDTLGGATSADVHAGLGHPGAGMTSQELHGGKRKSDGSGLEGVGASSTDPIRQQRADVSVQPDSRGKTGNPSDITPEQDKVPTSAETVAAMHK
ncbi:hypothetical protein VDGE_02619 [Verticillium dahliae]|uniref:Uncharacterized protein n=1 Tax=Verticillium dahliae TaxID=27337 RepID=A0A444RSQ1_VERDA|nr:hypothetical protein VDGE_02619 [Verticillium dahliae]